MGEGTVELCVPRTCLLFLLGFGWMGVRCVSVSGSARKWQNPGSPLILARLLLADLYSRHSRNNNFDNFKLENLPKEYKELPNILYLALPIIYILL